MNRPQVVVACAWYQRAEYIQDTVNSLLAQSFDSFEVVIVNDGSPDPHVRDILNSYHDSRLQVIHQENTGFTTAIRRAIDASNAPYIAIMGAGDVCDEKRIQKQYECLELNHNLVGVACKVYSAHLQDKIWIKRKRQNYTKLLYNQDDFLSSYPITHGEMMFRRDPYNAIKGYREFFKFAQDIDLWLRLTEYGSIQILDEYLYTRRFFSDGVSANVYKQLTQKALSDFARQLHSLRKQVGFDLLDALGPTAGVLRLRSRSTSRLAGSLAFRYLRQGLISEAYLLCCLAYEFDPSITLWLLKSAMRITPNYLLSSIASSMPNSHSKNPVQLKRLCTIENRDLL